jgi:hypothetical protein
MDDLYHQEILDHYHHPDNFGDLKNPDYLIEETNASCGDSFTFYLKIKPSKISPPCLTKGELEGVLLQDLNLLHRHRLRHLHRRLLPPHHPSQRQTPQRS